MRILAVAAHPDDVEVLCAGTLARFARDGHELALAHMTIGDKGGLGDPAELARIRGAEAAAAAEVIGATCFGGICGDLELYETEPTHVERIGELLAATGPDLVITHAPFDYHPDHRITGVLVARATAGAEAEIWHMDTFGGVGFVPSAYVDVTETIGAKKEMLRCHKSQLEWMSSYRHADMDYIIEWTGRWRGLQAGVRYAEAFRPATPARTDVFTRLSAGEAVSA